LVCGFLVHTKAHQEAVSAQGLREQCNAVYLPKIRRCWRVRGRMAEITKVLFPRYLFVAPECSGQSIASVESIPGVRKLVRFGALYLPADQSVAEALKAREDPQSGCHRIGAHTLHLGMRVRIASGALPVSREWAVQDRVVILLDLLGQRARTMVAVCEIGT
jgi:transcription antitermination factor NusG